MDFSNGQNRFVRIQEVSTNYLNEIEYKTKTDPYYPTYHIAPHHGLLNDPNGLSYFKGRHHLFYQWFPLGPVHGLKHWYHVSTENFVDYEDHGIAMVPDQPYDAHGCFSGSALPTSEELHLYYTGNVIQEDQPIQHQVYAVMRDDKVEKKHVLVEGPEYEFTHNFRDPIVFTRENQYYMMVGGETKDQSGAIALYEGGQCDSFAYKGMLQTNFEEVGYMWECPNYFEQDGKGIFIFSPQGVGKKDKYTFCNVFSVVYSVGNPIDMEQREFDAVEYRELDKGFDFYAPQTYEDHIGRRILIGWLGNSKSDYPTTQNRWAHMLTLPRELRVENGIIYQSPLIELEELREGREEVQGFHVVEKPAFEMELNIGSTFKIELLNEAGDKVVFSSNGAEFQLNRTNMTDLYAERFGTERFARRKIDGDQQIRLFVDHSSLEIFCDEGETVFTSRIFLRDLAYVQTVGVTGSLYSLAPINMKSDNQTPLAL